MAYFFFFCSIYSLVFIVSGDKRDGRHSGLPSGEVKAELLCGTLVGPVTPNSFRAASRRVGPPHAMSQGLEKVTRSHQRSRWAGSRV